MPSMQQMFDALSKQEYVRVKDATPQIGWKIA